MSPNDNNFIREFLIKRRNENLRQKSVRDIIDVYHESFNNNSFNMGVILSPRNYPYDEILQFDPNDFDEYFSQIVRKRYNLNDNSHSVEFFDPHGYLIDYSAFDPPIIPEIWFNLSRNDRFNNSIIIKNDGVIYFNSAQNSLVNERILLNLNLLCIYLNIFFSQIIPEIYNRMNYDEKVMINAECSGLNDCYLQIGDSLEGLKSLRDPSSTFKKSYILNLQRPIQIKEKIILYLKWLFNFNSD